MLVAVLFVLAASRSVRAQDSLSPSLSAGFSDSLSQSTSTSGFDQAFDPSTANLTAPDLHTDVSDDTHSQLLGSAFSPLANSYASFSAQTAPTTATLTNSQSVTGFGNYSFGGRRSQNFASTGIAGSAAAIAARQTSLGGFGASPAFSSAYAERAAFSGQTQASSTGTSLGFSGEGIPNARLSSGSGIPGAGISQVLAAAGGADPRLGLLFGDPVLTGINPQADLQMGGDMASPSTATSAFFAEETPQEREFQYDDGQTPPLKTYVRAGSVMQTAPEYGPNPTGFPDSTKGLAGLATESSNAASPFVGSSRLNESPFAPVSDGTVYGFSTRLNPSLKNLSGQREAGSFEAAERRAQEMRLTHGLNISQSSELYQQDLRNYRQGIGRRRHSPTLQELESTTNRNQNDSNSSNSTLGKQTVIR